MTLRLLHLADLHLDTVVGGRTQAVRARVRAALLLAFERAVEFALQEAVDAVLIAGDAFDDPLLSQPTAERFRAHLWSLAEAGVAVAWCTGNHDPGARSLGSRQGRAALLGLDDSERHGHPRIHVFRRHTPTTIEISGERGDLIGTVTSIGHRTASDTENLAQRLVRPDSTGTSRSTPAVAMLHTQVLDSLGHAIGHEEHAPYAPCTTRDLTAAGFDYWALGHVHVRGPVPGTHAWYAGNPQGRNLKETGARGGLYVEVDAGESPRVTPVDFSALRFERVRLAGLDAVEHGAQLHTRVAEAVRGFSEHDIVLRLELVGHSPLAASLRRPEARRELEQALVVELDLVDCELALAGLTPPRDLADFHATPSALREAHRLLSAAAENGALALELAEVELSPEAPPDLENGANGTRATYLREQLHGAADELLARALGEVQP
jgi:exonuclease SbcD